MALLHGLLALALLLGELGGEPLGLFVVADAARQLIGELCLACPALLRLPLGQVCQLGLFGSVQPGDFLRALAVESIEGCLSCLIPLRLSVVRTFGTTRGVD